MASRYLLDTNVLLHVVNKSTGFEQIESRLSQVAQRNLYVSAVTVWEISRMVERAKVSKATMRATLELLDFFEVLPLTNQVAALSGSLAGSLQNQGTPIGERDSMIAGTAMSHKLVMVTDNLREFARVPGILVENWRGVIAS